ncbi:MAG: hypothetical protein NTW32_13505 [Chloroflexi bacterium]|nr:hypothetical protein [Chloroflexota bacterium]
MKNQKYCFFLVISLGLLLFIGCTPGAATQPPAVQPSPTPTPTPLPCPQYGFNYTTDPLQGGDVSSGEIYAVTYATQNNNAWCWPNKITISKPNLGALPTCPAPKGCLNAIDLGPDDLKFVDPNNSVLEKPKLTFDLGKNTVVPKENCSSYCYVIYQLAKINNQDKWVYAADAKADTLTIPPITYNVATGNVAHFSVFAIVELPPPTPPSQPFTQNFVVASDFVLSLTGDMGVAFQVLDQGAPELIPGQERLFRFVGFNEKEILIPSGIPEACQDVTPLDRKLSCIFPIGTQVKISIDIISPTDWLFTIVSDPTFVVQWHNEAILFY